MVKQRIFCAIFFSLPFLGGDALAQTNFDSVGKNDQVSCARCSMQVVRPPGDIDFKSQISLHPLNQIPLNQIRISIRRVVAND
jgi:hypothetical protein